MIEKKKKRIALITHDLDFGGLQRVIVTICNELNREVFEPTVICLRGLGAYAPEVKKLGIEIYQIPQRKNGTDYFSFIKVAKILRKLKIEIIHTHNTQPFIDGTLGAILSGIKKIIHTDHARLFPDKKRYMFAEWLMSLFATKIVGVSDHTSKNLQKYEKISTRKIVTVPNGIYGSIYQCDIDKAKLKNEIGIKGKGPIIGLGVRLADQKGIGYLLQSMTKIIKQFPDISLIIAGDGPLRRDLENIAQHLHIESSVYFIGSRINMHEIIQLFDIYVLPSIWEGLPMVLLEAMAAGIPIIATNVGGNATAIKNGFNGLLVEAQDADSLSTAVIALLKDVSAMRRYSRNSLELFNAEFTSKIMVKKYEELYLL